MVGRRSYGVVGSFRGSGRISTREQVAIGSSVSRVLGRSVPPCGRLPGSRHSVGWPGCCRASGLYVERC